MYRKTRTDTLNCGLVLDLLMHLDVRLAKSNDSNAVAGKEGVKHTKNRRERRAWHCTYELR